LPLLGHVGVLLPSRLYANYPIILDFRQLEFPDSLLVSLYHMLKTKQPYRELGADFLDRRNAENIKRYLLKRLASLGLQVSVQSSEDTTALLA
jgi:hypothetical protein